MPTKATTVPLFTEPASHHAWREGAVAGAIGAVGVAAWFFFVDLAAGQLLYTPAILGDAVLAALRFDSAAMPVAVLVYTLVHLIAFALVGTIGVVLVHAAMRDISMLYGILVLFVVFEVAFYLLVYALDISLLGTLGWINVAVANLLAALLMGGYVWRTHPALHGRVAEGLSGVGSV